MNIAFTSEAFKSFTEWSMNNKQIYKKIVSLIIDICRDPFSGIGKPEPLKHELSGYWSRRITAEHRLVYSFDNDTVKIISCEYHY